MPSTLKRTRSFYGNADYQSLPKKSRKMYERRAKPNVVRFQSLGSARFKAKAPFAEKTKATLRYVEDFNLDPATGALAKQNFSANGCFDPNITGIGHQPYGFDTYMSIYNHYRVLRSRIAVTFAPVSNAAPTGNMVVSIGIKDDTTTESNMLTARETKDVNFLPLGSYEIKTVRQAWKATDVFNGNHDSMSGTDSANPTEQSYYNVCASHMVSTQDGGSVFCMAVIEYDVEFYELKDLGGS